MRIMNYELGENEQMKNWIRRNSTDDVIESIKYHKMLVSITIGILYCAQYELK